jgi:class 3 adenylate cyclase
MLAWLGQEEIWNIPEGRRFFEALGQGSRLITYDYRGMGASQRDVLPSGPGSDAADLDAVVSALALETFTIFSISTRGAFYAARHPDRVSRLILYAPTVKYRPYTDETISMIRGSWGMYTRASASVIFPSGSADEQRAISDAARHSADSDWIVANGTVDYDFTDDLGAVRCPTLVLHREGDQSTRLEAGRRAAALIPGAHFVRLAGDSHHPMWRHQDYMYLVHEFLGLDTLTSPASGTAVILFADIVDSTAITERIGDAAFHERSAKLHAALREALRTAGGRVVEGRVLGDGVLAIFEAAKDAIAAATACHQAAATLELQLHVGVHAGDVIRDGNNVHGGAVNIAARVSAASAPGETLVSEVVRHLARTSAGVTFVDRGDHALKGIDEPHRLYAVGSQD